MEMALEGYTFQEVKQKAIEIYQKSNRILDFSIRHKRNTNIWIIAFKIPNSDFITNFMLDK
jgi:hypothetical protein